MKTLLALTFLFTLALPAIAQQGDCPALTHQALELSGLNQSILDMTQMLNSERFMQQVSQRHSGSSGVSSTIKRILMKDFDGSVMRNELETRVLAQCDPAQMSQAIAVMRSPLVAKMLVLEANAAKPENTEKNNRCVRAAQVVPPPDERMDAVADLDDSSGASDFATDALIVMNRGMLEGGGFHFEGSDYLERHRQDLKANKSKDVQVSMLCTYESVSRAEILEYSNELRSGPLKTFYDQAKQALLAVMEERARAVGADLKTVITASR